MDSGAAQRPTSIGAVLPAFNREDTIERAVRSALDQTRPPNRVVVVDDGSTDGTRERVRRFGDRVTLVEQPNRGAAAARNRGAAALDTEWVAFLDSDDHWDVDHLRRMDQAIERTRSSADLYFADAQPDDPMSPTWWKLAGFSIPCEHHLVSDATPWVMLPLQPILIQASVVRRARYLDVGGMWTALRTREDTHLLFLLGMGKPFCAVSGVGCHLTADDSSGGRLTAAAGVGTADYAECTVLLYRDLLGRWPDLAPQVRRELRTRLMDGYLDQASAALHRRDPSGLAPLVRAFRIDPSTVVRRTLHSMREQR